MNMFHLAIASIVDANTGNGLVHGGASPDYGAFEKYGRHIRSRSVISLFGAIRKTIAELVESYRAKAKMQRDLNRLLRLNDHLLDDIGIQRGDLYSVQSGAMQLDELQAGRRSQQGHVQLELKKATRSATHDASQEAVNEQFYEQRQCA